jgi:phosphoribosylamine--glycine ligase
MVIGGGAREHALTRRLAADPNVSQVVCAPGNPGIAAEVRTLDVNLSNPDDVVALAVREQIDLTVVGPELPLSVGVADRFQREGRLLFGPTASAARLETSKAFAKAFMTRYRVPTAPYRTCETVDEALGAVASNEFGFPLVLKADGLAAGKGVVIAADAGEARSAIIAAMTDRRFGAAGARLVVEACLTGAEVSFFVVSDGTRALSIGTAQDHKRIFDDDRGPNTGGMGAFAPSPLIDDDLHARVMREIVNPVIAGMSAEADAFTGFLYVGLILTADGPQVIEFNVRLGDPEAQVVLPLIEEPLAPVLAAAAAGRLKTSTLARSSDKLVGVVLASRGYPDSSDAGRPITGIDQAEGLPGVTVLHAGTAMREGRLVTGGGRVLTVVGRGPRFPDAIERAYAGVAQIAFDGMHFRRDIGRKAIQAGT